MSATISQEKFLERKIVTLEQRLAIVERFVDMRFSETFRDFTIRSSDLMISLNESIVDQGRTGVGEGGNDIERSTTTTGVSHEDDPSPPSRDPSPSMGLNDDDSVISYRTRSGRKSKRLTLTSGLGSTRSECSSRKVPKLGKSKAITEEMPIARKVLRVHVPRLDEIPQGIKHITESGKEDGVRTTVIKVSYDDSDEEGDVGCMDDNGDKDDDYITFSCGEDASESLDGGNEAERRHETNDVDPLDKDWVPPDEETDNIQTEKEAKSDVPKKRKWRSQKGRKKAPVLPGSQALLPQGIQLQLLKPNKANIKECPVCKKHFKARLYDQHLETHIKERHLQCPYCDKRFYTKGCLSTHKKRHLADKYGKKCRLCSKVFVGQCMVLYHERRCIKKHLEDEKPVDPAIIQDVRERSKNVDLKWPNPNERAPEGMKKCLHCKRYISEDLYRDHLRDLHSNWKCNFCDSTFVHKSGLVTHLCTTHGQNRVSCNLCNMTFEGRQDLRSHQKDCKKEHHKRQKLSIQESAMGDRDTGSDGNAEEERRKAITDDSSVDIFQEAGR